MQQYNIDRYFNLLRMKGYEVKPRYDKQRKLVGYTVGKNVSVFKASEIGRKFMASKIEDTWKKLHPQPTQVKTKPVSPSVAPAPRPVRPVAQTSTASQPKAQPQIAQTAFHINTGDEVKKVWIPNSVKDVFTNEVQIPEGNDIATTENVAHVAMLLFAGYIDAATPCLSHVAVAVLLLLLVGVKKTMKMTGSLLIVAHRWLIQFAKERQWMTAQMQMHIREVNYMFADERKKVRERYKEYDGCYLGHYAQWFFWFFFTIGIFVVAGGIGMMIAQCYNR